MKTETNTERLILASENCHWYAQDGAPCYEVRAKNGEMRPTNLRDAKKLSLVPSVTKIIGVAAQPGLQQWKDEQLLSAALTLPMIEGEDLHSYAKRVVEDSRKQANAAAEKGTEVHAMIEKWFLGGVDIDALPVSDQAIINGILRVFSENELPVLQSEWKAETSFASPYGYGGKVDLHNDDFVVDFKTKANWDEKTKLGYESHAMQLAAYDIGLCNSQIYLRRINVFISTEEPGKVAVVEWDQPGRYWAMFDRLLSFWKLQNEF